MNKTKLQRVLNQIEHEALSPIVHTVDDYLHLFANYRKARESEQTNFPAARLPITDSSVDKFYCDYLTWKFSWIFDRVGKKCPESAINGYEALAKLNGDNLDFSHVSREFSPFIHLAELYTLVGNQCEVGRCIAQEEERRKKLKESDNFFHKGINEHRNWKFDKAEARYRKSLQINPYHTKARVLLGFLHSTSIAWDEQFQKLEGGMIIYSEPCFGGIPIARISESSKGVEANLGVDFQSQYYRKINPEDLKILLAYDGFGESNNWVFKYVRDFSEELQKLMADYSPLLKRSAFKFYRKGKKEEEKKGSEPKMLSPYKLERIGLGYFSEVRELNVPKIEREPTPSEAEFLELNLIEGMSMYDFLRTMEQLKVTPKLRETVTDALVSKQIQDLVKIQNCTNNLRLKYEGTAVKKPEYSRKLREAFDGSGGLIVLVKKYFGTDLSYPKELDEVGKELDQIASDEDKLVVYKDASPRNTKIDFRSVAKEMGLAEARETKDIVKLVLEECEKEHLHLELLAQAFANNLHQLDFEKIDRLAHEFDDLVEIVEFPYFNPHRNGERKWEEMYQLFLGLKGKEDNPNWREEYHLISLNRNIRWMYYLMKWFDRPHQQEDDKKQHFEDLDKHARNAQRTVGILKEQYNCLERRTLEEALDQVRKINPLK